MHKRLVISSIGLCSLLFTTACEGGGSNNAPPRLIEGGGLSDGEIDGKVNIFVIDGDSEDSAAIASAQIYIGEAGEDAIEGETDSTGLLTITDGSLAGPTTITVVADGFVTSTWYGANGANITMPMNRPVEPTDFGQATLQGSIEGWADLPEPPANHFVVGILGYSQTTDLGDAANEIKQPAGAGLPPNACVRAATVTECNWSLISRTGDVALSATIIDIDTKGNEDESDDTSEVMGFAYKLGVAVEDGVGQSGISLKMLDTAAHTNVGFDLPSAPSGVDTAGLLLGIELGDEGVMMLGFVDAADTDTLLAPELTGDFAGASFRSFAFASNKADEDEEGRPTSAILLRGITDVATDIDFGDWMDLPSELSISGDEFTYTAATGAALSTADIYDSRNEKVWSMVFLDERTTFTLPSLSIDPIGSGSFDFAVSGLDDEINLSDFVIEDLSDTIDRIATNRTRFTR
jgi:hypothetical protein